MSSQAEELCESPTRDRSREYWQIAVSLFVLATVFVALRLVACGLRLHVDDTLAVVAWIIAMPIAPVDVLLAKYGMGKDLRHVPTSDLTQFFLLFWVAQLLYTICTGFVKVAILSFYIRLFPGATVRRVCVGMIVFLVLMLITSTALVVFQCTPVSYAWLAWDGAHQGVCRPIWIIAMTHGATTILLDVVVLLIPVPVVLKLKVDWSRKIQVIGKQVQILHSV